MTADTLFVLRFAGMIVTILALTHTYRTYIAPFESLQTSYDFWRLRRCLKACYRRQNPCKISCDYRNQFKLNNVELTYGEILLHSFYQSMKIAQPREYEVFYDLGSGTGKLTCSAAILFNFKKIVGIEMQQPLHHFSTRMLRKLKALQKNNPEWQSRYDKVQLIEGDFLQHDISDADVIFINATCFQLETWRRLEEKFCQLKPGARILMTTKYLKEPYFKLLHTMSYEMSWGYARLSIFVRTAS